MSFEYENGLLADALRRYRDKTSLVGLDKCPYKLPFDNCTNNPKLWPYVTYHDIDTYLI